MSKTAPLRIGISQCLLGEQVRFDGGHKHDHFLTDVFGRFVDWVPVCPEVEVGMGVPREAIRLVGDPGSPRLVTIKTGIDHTHAMTTFSERRARELEAMDLSGFVFKSKSPSCGMERVRVYNPHGMPGKNGVGLFAQAFMNHLPLIPAEEEGRLNDPVLRENFIERVFCYRRWKDLVQEGATRKAVIAFHTEHKYLLLAHSRPHYLTLGRLVGDAKQRTPGELASRYGVLFMEALTVKATVRKHVNVLNHIMGFFKDRLSAGEKEELRAVIDDYHNGLTPLIVPLTLIKHYVRLHNVAYIQNQAYLHPHPKELMLRNHV